MQRRRLKKRVQLRAAFSINDHIDILIEILKRLDGRSLGVAACVCRLWSTVARNDSIWEDLCFRHVISPPPSGVRPVIVALGGYKRLYMVCLSPLANRRLRLGGSLWTRNELQLSLSLFSVDYYERLGRLGAADSSAASSLMFLCNPLNVS
ncbi:F-box family protein [Euphorbia peplus]|nr:F-box family protein [Euphorbia peplus]